MTQNKTWLNQAKMPVSEGPSQSPDLNLNMYMWVVLKRQACNHHSWTTILSTLPKKSGQISNLTFARSSLLTIKSLIKVKKIVKYLSWWKKSTWWQMSQRLSDKPPFLAEKTHLSFLHSHTYKWWLTGWWGPRQENPSKRHSVFPLILLLCYPAAFSLSTTDLDME